MPALKIHGNRDFWFDFGLFFLGKRKYIGSNIYAPYIPLQLSDNEHGMRIRGDEGRRFGTYDGDGKVYCNESWGNRGDGFGLFSLSGMHRGDSDMLDSGYRCQL